jgi:hypothetical protein
MKCPRYLLVKHIPDIDRAEPRNIGIVLWTPWGVEARFSGEKAGSPGEIDGRSIPEFVRSKGAYRQWIRYWRNAICKDALQAPTGGANVPRNSPSFADTLMLWNKADFLIEDGGMVFDAVDEDALPALVNQLFERLVEPLVPSQDDVRDPGLDDLCSEAIRTSGVNENPFWKKSYSLSCPIGSGVAEDFEFTYAFANGTLNRLYQRVPFSTRKKAATKAVHDCAWMFDKVVAAKHVLPDKCVSLVHFDPDQTGDKETERLIQVLSSVSRVLNVAERDKAVREFTDVQNEALHP